jgi:hypothetical protein
LARPSTGCSCRACPGTRSACWGPSRSARWSTWCCCGGRLLGAGARPCSGRALRCACWPPSSPHRATPRARLHGPPAGGTHCRAAAARAGRLPPGPLLTPHLLTLTLTLTLTQPPTPTPTPTQLRAGQLCPAVRPVPANQHARRAGQPGAARGGPARARGAAAGGAAGAAGQEARQAGAAAGAAGGAGGGARGGGAGAAAADGAAAGGWWAQGCTALRLPHSPPHPPRAEQQPWRLSWRTPTHHTPTHHTPTHQTPTRHTHPHPHTNTPSPTHQHPHPHTTATPTHPHPHPPQVLTDFLRIVLEIINCVLCSGLQRNPELVYSVLHKQEAFRGLRQQQRLAELLDNVQGGGGGAGWLASARLARLLCAEPSHTPRKKRLRRPPLHRRMAPHHQPPSNQPSHHHTHPRAGGAGLLQPKAGRGQGGHRRRGLERAARAGAGAELRAGLAAGPPRGGCAGALCGQGQGAAARRRHRSLLHA